MAETSVITAILAVFTAIGEWFVDIIPTILTIFYAEGSLTFIGALAACGLGVGLILLVMNLITDFIRFR